VWLWEEHGMATCGVSQTARAIPVPVPADSARECHVVLLIADWQEKTENVDDQFPQ
jgi:hypothetical protein